MPLQVRRVRVVTVADLVNVDEFGREHPLLDAVPEQLAREIFEGIEGRPWTASEAICPTCGGLDGHHCRYIPTFDKADQSFPMCPHAKAEPASPFLRGARRG